MPAIFLAHAFQRELERDFIVVHWDRRGAGKSYKASNPVESLTVSQTLEDLFELTANLRKRFNQKRIILVGHSWGSYLGLIAIREMPIYHSAYVGTGQLAGSREEAKLQRRQFLKQKASLFDDTELLMRLASGGEETEDDLFRYGGELYNAKSFWPILKIGLFAPEYTLWDILNVKRGADLVAREIKYDVLPKPLEGEILTFEIPIFFILGRHDYNTPSSVAENYFKRLHSPLKSLVWFEQSAHFPFIEESHRFHLEMLRIQNMVSAFWELLPQTQ